MTLIKSISGVRGIIDSDDTLGLTNIEIQKCVSQFVSSICINNHVKQFKIAIGRDGRVSGPRILNFIADCLVSYGVDVLNLDLTTTPSVQLAIISEKCLGGIMISASHNPAEWNGLKLLNKKGEFLSKKDGLEVFNYQSLIQKNIHSKGSVAKLDYLTHHIQSILDLVDVNINAIKTRKLRIVVDGINSSGGVYVPYLLSKFSVDVIKINCVPDGNFAHNPEPLPKNLVQLSNAVKENKADLGIAVDPDVDRLVIVCEDGSFFGEEYTIVAITKYILSRYSNTNVVSNLSTTMAVKDIANEFNAKHYESAVGEVNVVELMKQKKAIIGGEGSGGVIFALSHYGRDALVGLALFLSYLSINNTSVTKIRSFLPNYYMIKEKIRLTKNSKSNFNEFMQTQIIFCQNNNLNYVTIDGIKMYYKCGGWAHIRNSNTEPLIRLIIESKTKERALAIKQTIINDINDFLK